MTLLKVPYAYHGEILPGPRHSRLQPAFLRDDALVEVPDLGRGDMEVAIRIPGPAHYHEFPRSPANRHILRRKGGDGRLFAPLAMHRAPIAPKDVAEAFREYGAKERQLPFDFDRRDYPRDGSRHRAIGLNPATLPTFAAHAMSSQWPMARLVSSDLADREGEAVTYLSQAFVFVDGALWAECPEPAWMVRHMAGRHYELIVILEPWLWGAQDTFRLDQRERALEYADRRRRSLPPEHVAQPVEIAVPQALERDDVAEVAFATLQAWPRLRYMRWVHHTKNPTAAELNRVSEMGVLPRWEIPTVMDSVSTLLADLKSPLDWRKDRYAEAGSLYGGAARWAFERPSLDMSDFAMLSEDDQDALQGLGSF